MNDPQLMEQERKYMSYWQESAIDGPDPARLAAEMAARVAKFDRRILAERGRVRSRRCGAGLVDHRSARG